MRAFLAIDVNNKEVIGRFINAQKRISLSGADIKHVESENIHFTLKFFGEISEEQAKQIWDQLNNLSISTIPITYTGVGFFPSPSKISVIWVGVNREGSEKLASIVHNVDDRLKGLFVADRRPFQPHLTITRVRSGRNKEKLIEVIRSFQDVVFGTDILTSLKMKESTLTPKGPIYTDRYSLLFKDV